jgi:hypothetical protein
VKVRTGRRRFTFQLRFECGFNFFDAVRVGAVVAVGTGPVCDELDAQCRFVRLGDCRLGYYMFATEQPKKGINNVITRCQSS